MAFNNTRLLVCQGPCSGMHPTVMSHFENEVDTVGRLKKGNRISEDCSGCVVLVLSSIETLVEKVPKTTCNCTWRSDLAAKFRMYTK